PPFALAKAFSRSGCGRILPRFQRGLPDRLNTTVAAAGPKSVLSAGYSLNLMTALVWCRVCSRLKFLYFWVLRPEHFDAGGIRRDGTEIERSPLRPFASTGPGQSLPQRRPGRDTSRSLRPAQTTGSRTFLPFAAGATSRASLTRHPE
ncbi:hypothetical protein P1J78_24975, partial [Psychromarinibacter sp. C21-152]